MFENECGLGSQLVFTDSAVWAPLYKTTWAFYQNVILFEFG